MLYGQVLSDDDFNLDGVGQEGTGKDKVTYEIPIGGYADNITVTAEVYYQVTPPRWLEEMFEYSSDDIDHFAEMYDAADKDPVLVAHDELVSGDVGLATETLLDLVVYPNPSITGEVAIRNRNNRSIEGLSVYDMQGKLVKEQNNVRGNTIYLNLPAQSGMYFIKARTQGVESVLQVLKL
jgi:hypothetical protein